jgi:uncharacterized membrane protein (DUF485 family)
MSDPKSHLPLLDDPEFKDLARRKNSICVVLTIATLVVYYGFILLIAFNPGFFGHKFTENVPVGIPIGVGVIVFSWIFTGIYVRWANSKYDAMVENMKRKAGHGGP